MISKNDLVNENIEYKIDFSTNKLEYYDKYNINYCKSSTFLLIVIRRTKSLKDKLEYLVKLSFEF